MTTKPRKISTKRGAIAALDRLVVAHRRYARAFKNGLDCADEFLADYRREQSRIADLIVGEAK